MDRCVECSSNVQKTVRWKYIEGYEEKYRISDKGEVQYWDDNKKEWKTKAIKKTTEKNRYYRVSLSKSGKSELKYVHRLVAEAFIDNPEKKETVDHINGERTCNCAENLDWKTQKENNEAHENQKKEIILAGM